MFMKLFLMDFWYDIRLMTRPAKGDSFDEDDSIVVANALFSRESCPVNFSALAHTFSKFELGVSSDIRREVKEFCSSLKIPDILKSM